MKNTGVLLARSLAYVELSLLDPKARIFYPDLIREITKEFSFQKAPGPAEWEEKKGLEFKLGKTQDVILDGLKIFDTLVVVETHSNTSDSEKATHQIFNWAKDKFGLVYTPEMIRSWGYVSDVFFETDFPLLDAASKPLTALGTKVTDAMARIWREKLEYKPLILTVGHDPQLRKNGIAPFTIQLRAENHFSDNKWFSEAPLPTDLHFKLLQEFETDLLAASK
jgi:hypothetical protein